METRERSGPVKRAYSDEWNEADAKSVAHAEVFAIPVPGAIEPPDGAIQMAWTDATGFYRQVHVVQWWRLDRQGLGPGVEVRVDVQARQRRDMSCPPHHVSAQLIITGDPADKAQVLIGDPERAGSWSYGIAFHGATLLSTSVLIDDELPLDGNS
jgi:hypothetical protein